MKIKKGDILTIIGLLALGLVMIFAVSKKTGKEEGQILRIEKDSKLVEEVPLNEDREIVLDDGVHYNKIVIKDGKATMEEANCRDQICTHMPDISMDGETIICLPNRVFLEVVDKDNSEDGIDKINR